MGLGTEYHAAIVFADFVLPSIERLWLVLGKLLISFFAQTGIENVLPIYCRGFILAL